MFVAAAAGVWLIAWAVEGGEPSCDPLVHFDASLGRTACEQGHALYLAPLPNDHFVEEDAATPTGLRVRLSDDAVMPRAFSLADWALRDGWSASGALAFGGLPRRALVRWAGLGQDASTTDDADSTQQYRLGLHRTRAYGLASHASIPHSISPHSPTVLLDAETGERVPHWVELDLSWKSNLLGRSVLSANDTAAQTPHAMRDVPQMFLLNPARKLKPAHRYIVVLKDWLAEDETPMPPLEGFRLIRDRAPIHDPILLQRKRHFNARRIFESLVKFRIVADLSNVLLAWDFTTASTMSATEHLKYMRNDGLHRVEERGFTYQVRRVIDDYSEHIYRRVDGEFLGPMYVVDARPSGKSMFERNASAPTYRQQLWPRFQGWSRVPFSIWIPRSALHLNATTTVVQYGHGLFGKREEADQLYLQKLANDESLVLFATDWWGLSSSDIPALVKSLGRSLANFRMVPERCSQGVLNALVMARLIRSSAMCNDSKVFRIENRTVVQVDTASNGLKEVKHRLYYGNSLGGILGTVYMALSQDVKGPFSLLFPRNLVGWSIISRLLAVLFPNANQRIIFLIVIHQLWELCDPTGYTEIFEEHNGNHHQMGVKKLLLNSGDGDAEVSGIATGYLARSLGACVYKNNAYERYYRSISGKLIYRSKTYGRPSFDNFGYFPLVGHNQTCHTILTTFHFRKTPWTVSFENLPQTLHDYFLYSTHDITRLSFKVNQQIVEFIRMAKLSNDSNRLDSHVWVPNVCGRHGCWMLDRPKTANWLKSPPHRTFREINRTNG